MDHRAYIAAAADTLGLKIPAQSQAGVVMYFDLAAGMAELLQGLPSLFQTRYEPGEA